MEEKKLLLDVNEKPEIWKWIILAIQHVFAMFGATILVPITDESAKLTYNLLIGRYYNSPIGYNSVVGTSGYEWLESEYVRKNHKENDIDVSYYDKLVTDAINEINKHCDFYEFVSSNPAPVKMLRSSIL